MKKFRAYKMIVELSDNYVNKFYGVGKTKNEVKENWKGNGDYAVVEDVTSDYPIFLDDIDRALEKYGYKVAVREIIEDIILRSYDNVK